MADDWLVALLRETPPFAWLSESQLRRAAGMGQVIRRPAGAIIVRQGDPGDAFYVVLSGRLVVRAFDRRTGTEKLLNYLSANDFFGEMALISKEPRMATIEALEDVELLKFDQAAFDRLLRLSPKIRPYFVRTRIDFPGKQWGEIAEVYERKHIYGFVESLFAPFLASIGFVLLSVAVATFVKGDVFRIMGPVGGVGAVLLILWVALLYIDWRDDYYLVTTERVIHSERVMLILRQERYEAPIEQVLTVTTDVPGVMARLLGFHDVVIRTASVGEPITFRYLPNAEWVQRAIMRMRDRALSRRVAEEKGERLRRLSQQIGLPTDEPASEPEKPPPSPTPPSPRKSWLYRLWNYFIPRTRVETPTSVTWRKHWTILAAKTGLPLLAVLGTLMLIAVTLAPGLLPLPDLLESWRPGLFLVATVPFSVALGWLIWRYEDWQNDIYVITETAIIDRESAPFGFREVKRIGSLADIESVYSDVPGVWARLLNRGNVFIDTAGTPKAYTFESVPDPIAVQQEVFTRLTAFREQREREQSQRRADEFAEWFGEYHQLVSQQEPSP